MDARQRRCFDIVPRKSVNSEACPLLPRPSAPRPPNTPTQTPLAPPLRSPPLQSKAAFVNLMCFYQLLSASETSAVCNQSIL